MHLFINFSLVSIIASRMLAIMGVIDVLYLLHFKRKKETDFHNLNGIWNYTLLISIKIDHQPQIWKRDRVACSPKAQPHNCCSLQRPCAQLHGSAFGKIAPATWSTTVNRRRIIDYGCLMEQLLNSTTTHWPYIHNTSCCRFNKRSDQNNETLKT